MLLLLLFKNNNSSAPASFMHIYNTYMAIFYSLYFIFIL